jgi:hypothetical protein
MKTKRWVLFLFAILFVVAPVVSASAIDIMSYCDVTLEACAKQDKALELLEDKYPHDITVDYIYYFDVSNAKKSMAHIALECANWQGLKDVYKSELQDHLDDLSRSALETYAGNVGLSMANFTFCLDTAITAWDVSDEIVEADDDGVSSAPSVRINMDMYSGSQTFTSLHALVLDYMGLTKKEVQNLLEEVAEDLEMDTAEDDAKEEIEDELVIGIDLEIYGIETCYDDVMNQNEENIDCGGVCDESCGEGSGELYYEAQQPLFLRVMSTFSTWISSLW